MQLSHEQLLDIKKAFDNNQTSVIKVGEEALYVSVQPEVFRQTIDTDVPEEALGVIAITDGNGKVIKGTYLYNAELKTLQGLSQEDFDKEFQEIVA